MANLVNEASNNIITAQQHQGVSPTDKDVLLGKGTPINNHPGNKNFRRLIQANHTKYDDESEGSKYLVARALVDSLYNEGSRFLKKVDGVWQEVEKKRAYGKAQQTLRDGAPKRREKKYRLLKEQLEKQATQKTSSPQSHASRASTPPPEQSALPVASVVSPIASPTSFLSLELAPPAVSLGTTPEDLTESSSHLDLASVCALDPWTPEFDRNTHEEELEDIILRPDAVFGSFVGNDQELSDDSIFSQFGDTPLLINDSDSDDDAWFDKVGSVFFT